MKTGLSHGGAWASGGQVLLEVITAMMIFTLVAFSLVMALQVALSAAKERNDADLALRGMSNQLALLHGGTILPIDVEVPNDGSGVTYHLTVAQEQMQDKNRQQIPGMYRATVTAKWKSDGQVEDRSVSELLYQP